MSDNELSQPTLRDEHMAQTRKRLLDAAIDVLCDDGVSEFSLRTVAKVAGVSAPTAYRHFPTSESLMAGVIDEFDRRINFGPYPKSVSDLLEALPRIHGGFEREQRPLLAYVRAQTAAPVRAEGRRRRAQAVLDVTTRTFPKWSAAELRGISALLQLFASSATWDLWRNVWGFQGPAAGKLAAWAVATLVREAEQHPESIRALGRQLPEPPTEAKPVAKSKKPKKKAAS